MNARKKDMMLAAERKAVKNNPPKKIEDGTKLIMKSPTDTTTKGRAYKSRGHFLYLNSYGPKGYPVWMWDEFVTIKNDAGYTIKVNLNKFEKVTR